ncbi:MAG: F0F1 ATP synthase subunit A [Vallitalea sp.]|jgi:F-type H+-transporting ATPase subunit a|nr:F0F1 ATP synthase subunit A [Vallitalea sp.]
MDLGIHVAKTIKIGNFELWITESMVNAWLIGIVLIIIALIIRKTILNPKKIPSGVQNVIEWIVELLDNFTTSTMGEHGMKFSSFYGGMFVFILLCNLSGLLIGPKFDDGNFSIGFLRPPTADAAVTFALALITFFMIQGYGIKSKGVLKWAKGLTEPMWPMTPLNIIGELANPISLSFRLFGNILGGTIIMGLYYNLPWPALIGLPTALHGYFDVFAGVLQAFIFVMLSMTFVSSAMD